jgi:hypothetical protein
MQTVPGRSSRTARTVGSVEETKRFSPRGKDINVSERPGLHKVAAPDPEWVRQAAEDVVAAWDRNLAWAPAPAIEDVLRAHAAIVEVLIEEGAVDLGELA